MRTLGTMITKSEQESIRKEGSQIRNTCLAAGCANRISKTFDCSSTTSRINSSTKTSSGSDIVEDYVLMPPKAWHLRLERGYRLYQLVCYLVVNEKIIQVLQSPVFDVKIHRAKRGKAAEGSSIGSAERDEFITEPSTDRQSSEPSKVPSQAPASFSSLHPVRPPPNTHASRTMIGPVSKAGPELPSMNDSIHLEMATNFASNLAHNISLQSHAAARHEAMRNSAGAEYRTGDNDSKLRKASRKMQLNLPPLQNETL